MAAIAKIVCSSSVFTAWNCLCAIFAT